MMHGRQLSFGKSIAENWQANLSYTLFGQAPAGNRAVTKDSARLWATPTQDSGVLTP
jgi:hypothetical protein